MPLTEFQKFVIHLLASLRSPDSHIAGGAAINRDSNSLRYSDDLDIFHDAQALVRACAEKDVAAMQTAGCSIEWLLHGPQLYRVQATRDSDSLKLDWTVDSVFRFPIQPDEEFGFCLHRADLATNKVLALVGRTEVRDLLDVIWLHDNYLSFGTTVWAACGKDPGYTPSMLIDTANRHSRYTQADLSLETLTRPVDIKDLKRRWIDARDQAKVLVDSLPPEEVGCLYLDPATRNPVTPDPNIPQFGSLIRHFGSVRGAWPAISGE